jgi:hypothetical protein
VVNYTPIATAADSFVVRTDSGRVVLPRLRHSAPGEVRVMGLPASSFGQARYVSKVDTASFVNEQRAVWALSPRDTVVAFSYVPARFAAWRKLLDPIVGASTLAQWVIGLVGVIGIVAALFAASKIPALAKLLFGKKKEDDGKQGGSGGPPPPSPQLGPSSRGLPQPQPPTPRVLPPNPPGRRR